MKYVGAGAIGGKNANLESQNTTGDSLEGVSIH